MKKNNWIMLALGIIWLAYGVAAVINQETSLFLSVFAFLSLSSLFFVSFYQQREKVKYYEEMTKKRDDLLKKVEDRKKEIAVMMKELEKEEQ